MTNTMTQHFENGTVEVAARLGISYRQLDYWIRTGMVTIADVGSGSGTRRIMTTEEIAALEDTVMRLRSIERAEREVRSGDYFKNQLVLHTKKLS